MWKTKRTIRRKIKKKRTIKMEGRILPDPLGKKGKDLLT
jgi:hypothetical protein